MKQLVDKITDALLNNQITRFADRIQFPLLKGISVWQVSKLYVKGIQEGLFSTRVAAVSWNLFFGFFPFLLFFFSVLPFLPKYELIEEYFFAELLPSIFPKSISQQLDFFISEIAKIQSESPNNQVSWFAIVLSIYFSSNGINAILSGFTNSYHNPLKRGILAQKGLSVLLTIFFTICICLQFLVIYYVNLLPAFATEIQLLQTISNNILFHSNHILGFLLFWICVFTLFYFGYHQKKKFKAILVSSLLSSLLFLASSYWFNIYIINFNKYDLLYGSLGAVMVFMLFIYFNVIFILVGFEFCALIHTLNNQQHNTKKESNG